MKTFKLSAKTINIRVLEHIIHGFVVFASVFLAFWLTEIRDNQNIKQTVAVALDNIGAEMAYNHKRIEFVYAYYLDMMTQIDSLETKFPDKMESWQGYYLQDWKGVQMPMLRSTAYQTLLHSGIAKDIPFENLNALAFIYNLQSIVEKGDNSYIELFVTDHEVFTLKKIKHFFQIYLEVMPDVITSYQVIGKSYLHNNGYHSEVQSVKLKILVEQRKNNFSEY